MATIFFFFTGTIALWWLSKAVYTFSPFARLKKPAKWEYTLYYFVALYPALSYIGLKLSGDYLFPGIKVFNTPYREQFILYTATHLILCLLSLTVIRFLLKQSKLNHIFMVTNSITGGLYFMLLFVTWIVNS